ncbi:unnamed protein product [Schistocephalus solidus]|uniref:Fer4_20 domain-containing protein n=1 Tax=Schistocephalus solidus TaxID=70667 RepID=A0A183SB04_SCHSO|nr:unnamed protein product [Schistocephalus solidus]
MFVSASLSASLCSRGILTLSILSANRLNLKCKEILARLQRSRARQKKYEDEWEAAHYAMMRTNNFPEFTGRVCPAPCEGACVLGIIEQPVAIKNVECAIGEVGWERGLNVPRPITRDHRTGKRIAIVGSGPSGLACAAQLITDEWEAAHYAMMRTNNFPEFTGRVCPAPCEGACVLGIIEQPVAIKNVECAIGEVGWERGLNVPRPITRDHRTGKRIAIVGSGPSGLACAAQLITVGHEVVVVERRNLPGGLLRYGIPTMKLDRKVLDRRLELMTADGVQFMCSVQVGNSSMDPNCHCRPDGQNPTVLSPDRLLQDFDATVLCLGSTWPRDLNVPGKCSC